MQKKLVVLAVENFEIKDDKTGEMIPSSKVYLGERRSDADLKRGNRGLSMFDVFFMRERREVLKGLVAVPGIYEAEVDIELRGKRAYPRYSGFKFLSEIKGIEI